MIVARLASAVAAVFLAAAGPASAAQVESLTPSDRFTVADPAQLTGRRVTLPLPNCIADPSGCEETRLLNELDGASVNPRIAIRFSAPIAVDSVTRQSVFIVPLSTEPLPSPVGLAQLVWDSEHYTLYARPERMLLQGRRYALVVTVRMRDQHLEVLGRPLDHPSVGRKEPRDLLLRRPRDRANVRQVRPPQGLAAMHAPYPLGESTVTAEESCSRGTLLLVD